MPKTETQTQWQDRMALEVLEVTRSCLLYTSCVCAAADGRLCAAPQAPPGRPPQKMISGPHTPCGLFPMQTVAFSGDFAAHMVQ